MQQILNLVQQGVQGIQSQFQKKDASKKIKEKFQIPENEECKHNFNCALSDKILLQGQLYVFKEKLCFYSFFNNINLIGQEKTYVDIKYSDINKILKKKTIGIPNAIHIVLNSKKKYVFTSFLQRDKAYQAIKLYKNQHQKEIEQQEEEWLQEQIQMIEQIKLMEQQEQNENGQQIRNQEQNNNDYINNNLQESDLKDIYGKNNNNNQDQVNQSNYLLKTSDNIDNNNQQQQQQQQYDPNQMDQITLQHFGFQQINQNQKNNNYVKEEQKKQQENEDFEDDEEEDSQIQQEIEQNPLKYQQEAQQQWNIYQDQLSQIFAKREQQINEVIKKHDNKKNKITWDSIILKDMSVREVYLLFFSNQQFEDQGKKYKNFFEFYMKTYNKEYNINITEIIPNPPEIYQSLYTKNTLQLQDCQLSSSRQIKFTHPLEPSFLLPDKIEGKVRENLYWVTDNYFVLERFLNFQGMAMADSFEPRIIYTLKKHGDKNVELKTGFYIHFLKSTWFKSKIENGAMEENKKAQQQLSSLFMKLSDKYKNERNQNKHMMLQKKESQGFINNQEQVKDVLMQSRLYQNPIENKKLIEQKENKIQNEKGQQQYYSDLNEDEQNSLTKSMVNQLLKQQLI